MSGKLGSRLAQLANAKKQAEEGSDRSPENIVAAEAEAAASNLRAVQLILLPHVEEFNSLADMSLQIALEVAPPCIVLRQRRASLLSLEVTAKAAVFKRKPGSYTSEDYFTIDRVSDGTMTFRNYSAEVAPPHNASQFAELVLTEALGLNE